MSMMTANEGLNINFHFEYSLESQKCELEAEEYVSYGVSVKMVNEHGQEVISSSIQDITPRLEVARNLIQSLDSSKISPMCLKVFVEDFLVT